MEDLMSLTAADWFRALLCLLFFEGALYFLFPKVIQNFATEILVDAPLKTLRLYGALMITVGFILWSIAR